MKRSVRKETIFRIVLSSILIVVFLALSVFFLLVGLKIAPGEQWKKILYYVFAVAALILSIGEVVQIILLSKRYKKSKEPDPEHPNHRVL